MVSAGGRSPKVVISWRRTATSPSITAGVSSSAAIGEFSSAVDHRLLIGLQHRWWRCAALRRILGHFGRAARVPGRCRAARCRGTTRPPGRGWRSGSMSLQLDVGAVRGARCRRDESHRGFAVLQAPALRGARPVAGLQPQPPTAPNPRRRREGPAVPAAPRRSRTRPPDRMPCGPSPPENSGPSASANERCRCAPLPASPSNGTGEKEMRRPCRAAARPITMRAAATVSTAATGVDGARDTSSWSWPYSVWICSTGSPARSAAVCEVDQERRAVQRGAHTVGRPRIGGRVACVRRRASCTRARRRSWRSNPSRSRPIRRRLSSERVHRSAAPPCWSVRSPGAQAMPSVDQSKVGGIDADPQVAVHADVRGERDAAVDAEHAPRRRDAHARALEGLEPAQRDVLRPCHARQVGDRTRDEPDTLARADPRRLWATALNLLGRHECASRICHKCFIISKICARGLIHKISGSRSDEGVQPCADCSVSSPPPRSRCRGAVGERVLADFVALTKIHGDGWGVARVRLPGHDPRVEVSAGTAADDPHFAAATHDQRSAATLVHLRWATTGIAVRPENSHPFLADRIAMAHNGSIKPIDALDDLLVTRDRRDDPRHHRQRAVLRPDPCAPRLVAGSGRGGPSRRIPAS